MASGRPRSAGAGRGCSRVFVMGPREAGRLPRRGARRGPGRGRQAMVEPLKRPWSPISTASDTAVRADRAKAGQTPGGGGGARRRRGRPAMASSSRSRRAVVCTTVPAGRASSGAPAHWAPCRSRGRGGHAAPRAPAGSGFRAPGAVIDDPAAQQHPGAGGGGPSIRSPRAPGARAHQVTGPLLASGCGARTTGDIVVARQAGQQDRAPCDRS